MFHTYTHILHDIQIHIMLISMPICILVHIVTAKDILQSFILIE